MAMCIIVLAKTTQFFSEDFSQAKSKYSSLLFLLMPCGRRKKTLFLSLTFLFCFMFTSLTFVIISNARFQSYHLDEDILHLLSKEKFCSLARTLVCCKFVILFCRILESSLSPHSSKIATSMTQICTLL